MVLGTFRPVSFELLVSDPPVFQYYGMQDEPLLVLGTDFLSLFRLQIDRGEEEIRLMKPRPSKGISIDLHPRASRISGN